MTLPTIEIEEVGGSVYLKFIQTRPDNSYNRSMYQFTSADYDDKEKLLQAIFDTIASCYLAQKW